MERKIILKETNGMVKVFASSYYLMEANTAAMLAELDIRYDVPVREMEDRIRRAVEYAHIEEKEAEEYIRKADKSRASYYNYYTDKIWGAAESYDLCISSSVYGIDETTAFIREFVSKR